MFCYKNNYIKRGLIKRSCNYLTSESEYTTLSVGRKKAACFLTNGLIIISYQIRLQGQVATCPCRMTCPYFPALIEA